MPAPDGSVGLKAQRESWTIPHCASERKSDVTCACRLVITRRHKSVDSLRDNGRTNRLVRYEPAIFLGLTPINQPAAATERQFV
jgi:hypothetical protein